ncbi:TPA: hypothetical protein DCE37_01745 [Candidatus Latescibacteria bacterium]|nr:hypothetical protein [Gemmatimonadota bacterium]HAA73826.1 hypothetical protein [Candidatus Latescibacterota bacterium]
MRTLSKMALRHPGSRPARLIHKAFRHASFIETHTWPDLLSASGASTVFCLSFDCDTKEDAIALPKLTDALRRYEIPASFALIGELVEEAPDAYGRLVEAGYEIVNHGYSYHTAQRPDGTCYSSMFYHQLTAEQIHEEIAQNDTLLTDLLGADVHGFRTPHFSTFQRPQDRRVIYDVCDALGYAYSSSITSLYLKAAPNTTSDNVVEFPLTGCWDNLRSPFDSWGLIAAPDRRYHDEDFIRLFRQMLHASIETPDLILLNIYVDPSHVVSFEGFHQMLEMLVEHRDHVTMPTYCQLVDNTREKATVCAG